MKKRIVVIVLSILMMICVLPATAMAADTWDGTSVDISWYNTTDTEFTIDTAAELAGLAQIVNSGGALIDDPVLDADYHKNFRDATITLGGDIDLGGHEWTPIGYFDPSGVGGWQVFSGTFDGAGYTISGLAIGTADAPNTSHYMAGLFAEMNSLENLNVESDGIYSVYSEGSTYGGYVGVLAASADGSVTNCTATGDVTGGNLANIGGLAGSSGGDMTNCHASGNVVGGGGSSTGGLLGDKAGGVLTGCYATGNVTGSVYAGGLVGNGGAGTISDCYAKGNVTCNGSYTGGFIGYFDWNTSVSGCYATGKVTGSGGYVGGFAGQCLGSTLDSCFAAGNVQSSGSGCVGGFVGSNDDSFTGSAITRCYAYGSVTNTGNNVKVGGFAGYNNHEIINCYAAGSVSGGNHVDCKIGGLIGDNDKNIQSSYARGAVSGSGTGTFIGGFAGSNGSGATLGDCYFDKRDAGLAAGIGQDSNSQTVTGLTPDAMTGSGVSDNMKGLDFTTAWTAKANDSKWYFPQLTVHAGSPDSVIKAASLESVTLVPFTVAFDSNGGSAVDSEYGYYSAVNKPTDPTRTGHFFGGWYTDSDLTTAYDFGAAVTADMTLHAKWTQYKLTSSDADGIICTSERITLTPNITGGTWSFDSAAFSREGNTFTALKAGKFTITYTVDGASATYAVTVTASDIGGLPESHTLYKGGRVTWTPSPTGGTWQYDTAYLTATTSGSSTTFMAVKTGSTTVTYTVNGMTHNVAVTILQAELPSTGQVFTPVIWLFVSGLCVGLCAAFVSIRRRRKERV